MTFSRDDSRTEGVALSARDKAGQAVPGEPITVRIPRAIELTGIGRSKLYELIAEGEIEVVKVGSSTLVIFASLKALVARRREVG